MIRPGRPAILASPVIRALLFDFDGVIVDTEVPTYRSWCDVYREHGVELALADWLPVVGSGTSTAADSVFDAVAHLESLVGRRVDRRAVVERRSRRKTALCDRAGVLSGVADYLAEARRLVLKTAIVTRAARAWVDHHLARVELAHRWDAVVCSDGLDREPKSTFYLEALAQVGVPAGEALAFEDSPHGVGAAKAAGIRCVAVPNDVTRAARFREADVILRSLADRPLTDLLASLDGRDSNDARRR